MSPFRASTIALLCFLFTHQLLSQPGTPARSVVGFPGAGVLQAGDLWESFLPQAFGPFYGEGGTFSTEGARQFIRMGNFDRAWSTPNAHWPSGFPYTIFWSHYIVAQVFHPDSNFNPTKKGVAAPAKGNWGQVTYKPSVAGANDPARRYSVEPYFVDGEQRQHIVYEAAWPTNIGCDVKIRAHAFAGPNWGHFNDFVILEIEFRNTGQRDMDMDGVPDAALPVRDIPALALCMSGEAYMSVGSLPGGGRNENTIGGKYTRMGGWINDPDPEGNPWGFVAYYPGAGTQSPYPGGYNMGYNAVTRRAYSDIWIGWDWLAAKTGPLPADPSQLAGSLPDRNTIFGTHAIGLGSRRGWYLSAGSGGSLAGSYTDPKKMFTVSAGTFMKNGGATRTVSQLDLSPNPNYFGSGTAGDVTTWVPKTNPMQPNGDQKTLNTFDQSPYEGGSGYANGFGKWTTGYNFAHDFNGDLYTGIGPVKVPKDSSVTFVLALVGGYRLEGIQRAVRAARYVSQNGPGSVPALPAVPDLRVTMTFAKTAVVEWDSIAESSVGFAGYKIWRSSTADTKKWLEDGMRLSDRYQEQMVPGTDRTAYKKPVNPKFDAFSEITSSSYKGEYRSDSWGTWELLSVIPRAQLNGFPRACTPGYRYRYEDATLILDQRYWYYVSAYADGLFAGPGGETTDRVETHCVNRNGASGLWLGTYPFAFANVNFPRTREGLKQIGAGILIKSTVAYPAISFGSVNLGDSRDIAVVLRNSADSLLELVSVASDPEFTFAHTACSIAPGDSLRTTIRFTPTRLGQVTGCCYFMRNGSIIQDSLLVAGSGIAGKLAPQVTWECRDDTMRSPLGGPGVSIDAAGSVYSAFVPDNYRWTLRKHTASGGTAWSVTDSLFSYGYLCGLGVNEQGNTYLAMLGSTSGGATAMAPTVAKVSPGGVLLWVKSLQPPYGRSMECAKLALDDAGNAYVLGSSYARATGSNLRMTTAKFDPDGSLLWMAVHEGPFANYDSSARGMGIAVDGSGNVYVTGQRGLNYTSTGDIVTVKYNSSGAQQWQAFYNGPMNLTDQASRLTVGTTGDVYVLGTSHGGVTDNDIVLLKYRGSDGVLMWVDRVDGPAHGSDGPGSLVMSSSGDVIVAGGISMANGRTDGILLRYSPTGTRTVLMQYDGEVGGHDSFGLTAIDRDNNLFVGGWSVGTSGMSEPVYFKFSPGGLLEWEGRYSMGPANRTNVTVLTVGTNGALAIGGYGDYRSPGYPVVVAAIGQVAVDVAPAREDPPVTCALRQNYPNPFNPSTTIRWQLPLASQVRLVVYDILGREVAVLVDGRLPAGVHEKLLDASGLPSGVYLCRLQAGGYTETRKMVLAK